MSKPIYKSTRLRDEISISELVTLHYFEFSKDYRFGGEAHDFWELVYVDSGELSAVTREKALRLKSGDMIFHRPNEWHSLVADGVNASTAIIISFYCSSPALRRTVGRVFELGNRERALLSEIITEAGNAFDTPLSSLVTPKLKRKKAPLFGAEQIIKLNLCRLILSLLREDITPASPSTRRNLENSIFSEICSYLYDNLDKKLSLDDIARNAGISKTALKQLFKKNTGSGVCDYFIKLKIERAKTYIRENNYNFTQIAEMLGYNSVHYFSAQFKKIVAMSPTEYAASIRALTSEAERF